jgi:Uncharacterized conserved protein (DUF2190)
MAQNRPGRAHYATATKEVAHGAPCVEDNFAGIAIKQIAAPGGTGLGDDLITKVQVGEQFIIEHKGLWTVPNVDAAAATFAVGDDVWIDPDDNTTTSAHAGNEAKFGRVEAIAGQRGTPTGKMRVDLDARDSF